MMDPEVRTSVDVNYFSRADGRVFVELEPLLIWLFDNGADQLARRLADAFPHG